MEERGERREERGDKREERGHRREEGARKRARERLPKLENGEAPKSSNFLSGRSLQNSSFQRLVWGTLQRPIFKN